jgi:hypothetical protein
MNLSSGPYQITTYPWGKAQRLMVNRAISPVIRYAIWGVFCVVIIWVWLSIVAPRTFAVFGDTTIPIVVGVGLIVLFGLFRARNKTLQGAYDASVFRAGPWQATITDDGLGMASAGVRQIFSWAALTDVCDGPDGMLIMSGPAVYLPIPRGAFADIPAFDAFRAAAAARIIAARGQK